VHKDTDSWRIGRLTNMFEMTSFQTIQIRRHLAMLSIEGTRTSRRSMESAACPHAFFSKRGRPCSKRYEQRWWDARFNRASIRIL